MKYALNMYIAINKNFSTSILCIIHTNMVLGTVYSNYSSKSCFQQVVRFHFPFKPESFASAAMISAHLAIRSQLWRNQHNSVTELQCSIFSLRYNISINHSFTRSFIAWHSAFQASNQMWQLKRLRYFRIMILINSKNNWILGINLTRTFSLQFT